MATRNKTQSQLIDLFLSIAGKLGIESDKDIAALAGVSVENVANWRSGVVQQLKPQKLAAVKRGLATRIEALRAQAGEVSIDPDLGLVTLEIETGSGPSSLQRQLRDRIQYDYLGHRFLYFEPQGALAWENLIRAGYEQTTWLRGVEERASEWLDPTRDSRGRTKGPIASALGFGPKGRVRGLDVISFGPGEGGKEVRLLHRLLDLEKTKNQTLPWLTLCLADVSIALLTRAARDTRKALAERGALHATVMATCADFEEGPLSFLGRMPTTRLPKEDGLRLVLILGNVFGNVRDEETFLREKAFKVLRQGDMLWLEVGIRPDSIETEPLFRLTDSATEETAAEANRRLLLEGPYRRWEAARGRKPSDLEMRVFIREDDDSSRVPGSLNFCHDLIIKDEGRTVTMLYSRRYALPGLTKWLEEQGLAVERVHEVRDTKDRPRVAHLLLRKT
ncbi:MAG: L-histidine N(alpha)-methyltransferase [Deltaproteobacteria bacterium]|nr:L-histidine N(alpha)-methyltransferase [Deltaproteobacteria bacterium]